MKLNINTDAVVVYTNKLEAIAKRLLPVAARTALNSTAFNVKKETMPEFSRGFVNRQANFFKANSRVNMAKGKTLDSLESSVGFTPLGGTNYAVEDLQQQEYGGRIQRKSFIPLPKARGGSNNRNVRPNNRLSQIRKIADARKQRGKNNKQKFRKAAMNAGAKGYVLSTYGILWRIDSIVERKIKRTPLYSYQPNRSVSVTGTGFMNKAAAKSSARMEEYYVAAATKLINAL